MSTLGSSTALHPSRHKQTNTQRRNIQTNRQTNTKHTHAPGGGPCRCCLWPVPTTCSPCESPPPNPLFVCVCVCCVMTNRSVTVWVHLPCCFVVWSVETVCDEIGEVDSSGQNVCMCVCVCVCGLFRSMPYVVGCVGWAGGWRPGCTSRGKEGIFVSLPDIHSITATLTAYAQLKLKRRKPEGASSVRRQ
jgi:hypothetical protein